MTAKEDFDRRQIFSTNKQYVLYNYKVLSARQPRKYQTVLSLENSVLRSGGLFCCIDSISTSTM